MTNKPRKKVVKAWAVVKWGAGDLHVSYSVGVYTNREYAKSMKPEGYKVIPCTITYSL